MKYQGGFETFKEASRYMFQTNLTDILVVLFGFVASVVILVVLPYAISRYISPVGPQERSLRLLESRWDLVKKK